MDYNLLENLNYCYQLFVDDARLLLYTHLPPIALAISFSWYVYHIRKDLVSKLLCIIALLFSLFSIIDLLQWILIDHNSLIMATWSILGLLSALIFLSIHAFAHTFFTNRPLPISLMVLWFVLILPVAFLTPTTLNLESYDIQDCIAVEGVLFTNYYYFLGLVAMLLIALSAIQSFKISVPSSLPHVSNAARWVVLFGAELFIFAFLITGILASYLVDNGYVPDFGLAQYGIAAMSVFIGFIAYASVRYHAFNLKLLGAQALVITLVLLVTTQYIFVSTRTNFYLVSVTLLFTLLFGALLIRNVRQEVRQRERIEYLAIELEKANKRLKELDKLKTEFVSIASHQLRAPLAAIKGYASMVLEESFGKMTVGVREAVGKILTSSTLMARSVDDFLNVSRIELGKMKYDMSSFDLCELIKSVISEQTPVAEDKKLALTFVQDPKITTCDVTADMGKVKQVLTNLIDNAIKYTTKGSIEVRFTKDESGEVARISVKDTGMGMSQETMRKLFDKFVRADNANKVNVIGTGLGLYVVKQFVQAHGGKIMADSEGEGKGSTFTVELPLKGKTSA